jgi:hypothetical protein
MYSVLYNVLNLLRCCSDEIWYEINVDKYY